MFGYVRPLKDEMKVREFEAFKTCYCALCHTLKSRYGVLSRNLLSYDFAFLVMLLWEREEKPDIKCARCIASPFIKRQYCAQSPVLDLCAGCSVILSWWQLRDSMKDESFFGSLRDRLLSLLLLRAYRKASRSYPEFAGTVRTSLDALSRLEAAGNSSLDECADKFARITEALASVSSCECPAETVSTDGPDKYRPLRQLLYHTGRYIYIIDACDDLKEDLKKHLFNPVANRFQHREGPLKDTDKNILRATLIHSCSLIGTAFELLAKNYWTPILSNIIYLGMPETCFRVLDGPAPDSTNTSDRRKKAKGAGNKGMDKIL